VNYFRNFFFFEKFILFTSEIRRKKFSLLPQSAAHAALPVRIECLLSQDVYENEGKIFSLPFCTSNFLHPSMIVYFA
jgi:hypothetical protein